ncbi:MAG TPA: UV DNA damage repair endonuclease UvsE [candidate division Zixibacteria bacterium]|jgi:UV DNA damage endonuclease|nr:UV DNA damage repair endonuclease UvsE [candidate division Zixibacteria bacterium]HBZ01021.1 UV DNA damage repair endonuclease UvsE [candidate division Zixibacteria bacterium]
MPRLGLCCIFRHEPIKFRTTTAKSLRNLSRKNAFNKISELCIHNALSLNDALAYCKDHGVGAFRISSGILPLRTHPHLGYSIDELPGATQIRTLFGKCYKFALSNNIRTTFHPDQFVVLNSPRPDVVDSSVAELEYQGEIAELIGADVINIHAGGAYGDKEKALDRLVAGINRLSSRIRERLTLENDDKSYTPVDLLPLCWRENIPLVYDVHHHRCLPDGAFIEEVTEAALLTWNREPLFHISSPLNGWNGKFTERHHDFIDIRDFPEAWRRLRITVEVEAKAKEVAVEKLQIELNRHRF